MGPTVDITALLRKTRDPGDARAVDELVGALYPDLHRMAQAHLAKNNTMTLLDATSIVHETYERLRHAAQIHADCRGQFMAYASQIMRSIIVDCARKRRADRRGGGVVHVTLSTDLLDGRSGTDEDIERVNEAVEALEGVDQRLKQVVEMRYFGGFSESEIAECLSVNERTVRRDWERAKLLLQVSIRR